MEIISNKSTLSGTTTDNVALLWPGHDRMEVSALEQHRELYCKFWNTCFPKKRLFKEKTAGGRGCSELKHFSLEQSGGVTDWSISVTQMEGCACHRKSVQLRLH